MDFVTLSRFSLNVAPSKPSPDKPAIAVNKVNIKVQVLSDAFVHSVFKYASPSLE